MSSCKEAMEFRFACKKFNKYKTIPSEILGEILEATLLSPSSFGMQPWRITVAQSQNVKDDLRKACWDQPQLSECSDVIIFTCENYLLKPGSDYVKERFMERGLDEEATDRYIEVYNNFITPKMAKEGCLEAWSEKQAYIAAANLMTCAASLKVDSCPIEGFEEDSVKKILDLDEDYSIALLVALGYRDQEQSKRHRLEPFDVVSFI